MGFQKATKKACFARVALYGPSGAGKTYSALRIARGMGKKVALIDTEFGSASKYGDRFDFDTLRLDQPSIDNCVAAMSDAANGGYDALIIDSMTHPWYELLQEIDKLARAKFGGNTHAAWSVGTPKQQQFIRAILKYPGHVIATMRAKTEWSETEERGKKKYIRVGLNPSQGKDIEFEFDILMSIDVAHNAVIEKDRSGKFQDEIIEKPGEDFGKRLAEWLSEGEPSVPTPSADSSAPPKEKSVSLSNEDRSYLADLTAQTDDPDTTNELLMAMAFAVRQKQEPLRSEALKMIRAKQIALCQDVKYLPEIGKMSREDGVYDAIKEIGVERHKQLTSQAA